MVRGRGTGAGLLDAREIRDHPVLTPTRRGPVVIALPPREGFSPDAVGAIGLIVQRLAQPDDIVVGQALATPCFPGRHFEAASPVLWPPFSRVGRYMAGVTRTIRRLEPSLVEVHNRANLALHAARALPQTPVTLFVHNDPQAMRGARSPQERAALLAHIAVVCVSDYLRRRFMHGIAPGTRHTAQVLLNAVDWSQLPPSLPPEARDKTILFVGRVVADKGADAFVRACETILPQLPGWNATIIGADRFRPNAPKTQFERALYPRAQAAGITLPGYLPHAQVLHAMSRAAIVAVPSRWPEPFGMTALEAMASGAALVCSAQGGLPEVAAEAALYAEPDPPGPLEQTLLALARNPKRRADQAMASLAQARHFTTPIALAQLSALRAARLRGVG